MKRLLIVMAACALTAAATPASADHAWEGYHWGRTANPFTLRLVDSVTGSWDALLPTVATDWSRSNVLDLSTEPGADDLITRLLCQPVRGKVRVCSANYGPNFWFGLATVWISNGHISQATTQVNDFYFTGSYANDVARRHVLCQEVGHDLGLDHHRQASCMDDTNTTLNLTTHQSPNAHDLDQLAATYGHKDSSNSYASARSTVVTDLGNGTTVIRFIDWVWS